MAGAFAVDNSLDAKATTPGQIINHNAPNSSRMDLDHRGAGIRLSTFVYWAMRNKQQACWEGVWKTAQTVGASGINRAQGKGNLLGGQHGGRRFRRLCQTEFLHSVNESFPAEVQIPGSPRLVPLVLLQSLQKDLLLHFFQVDSFIG